MRNCFYTENLKDIVFISINTEIIDYEQLLLMSLCKHNIIANSSFSWWGAYFNTNAEKNVYYPNKWINSSISMNDLFPSNWNEII